MTAPPALTGALAAMQAVLDLLASAGITATDDPGAFYPQPVGVLVCPPARTGRGLRSETFSVPVLVVSGDPLNHSLPIARLYALADDAADALAIDQYRPSSWAGNVNAEPLPAVELAATVTLAEEA